MGGGKTSAWNSASEMRETDVTKGREQDGLGRDATRHHASGTEGGPQCSAKFSEKDFIAASDLLREDEKGLQAKHCESR